MKRFLALVFVLSLSVSTAVLAADSPVLPQPPLVSGAADAQGNSLWVSLMYDDQSQAELDALAKTVSEGKTELEHFALNAEDLTKLDALGLDTTALSADEMAHAMVGGYTVKPENISFQAAFAVPYPVGTILVVLMGVSSIPGPYQWTVQSGTVNPDGTVNIVLNDFPAEPFLLSILS